MKGRTGLASLFCMAKIRNFSDMHAVMPVKSEQANMKIGLALHLNAGKWNKFTPQKPSNQLAIPSNRNPLNVAEFPTRWFWKARRKTRTTPWRNILHVSSGRTRLWVFAKLTLDHALAGLITQSVNPSSRGRLSPHVKVGEGCHPPGLSGLSYFSSSTHIFPHFLCPLLGAKSLTQRLTWQINLEGPEKSESKHWARENAHDFCLPPSPFFPSLILFVHRKKWFEQDGFTSLIWQTL